MKQLVFCTALTTLLSLSCLAQTFSISGKVTDDKTGEAIIFANVALYANGHLVTGAPVDLDGNYAISFIPPGSYT